METNYELKHKCLLVPLKAVLLVIAMVLVGFTTYAQQGKSVKVANNQQLTEAMGNPSIGTIELEAGYYAYLNYEAASGAKVVKKAHDDGNRDIDCQYFIIGTNECFDPDATGFTTAACIAGHDDPASCGCCPGDNSGTWSKITGPGIVNFLSTTDYITDFYVDAPGIYLLRYTWGPPYNSLVETQYYFFGPDTIEISAPDVCGLTTTVDFYLVPGYFMPDHPSTITWYLDGILYAGPVVSGQFDLTVTECGLHELTVIDSTLKRITPGTIVPDEYCVEIRTIIIDFSCEPTADAGPDVNVCDDLCVTLTGSYGGVTLSPSYAWSWVQISGPGILDFNPDPFQEEVGVCREAPPACSYGEYEVVFQVQNGECFDSDTAVVRFYETPEPSAGEDMVFCNTFAFSLWGIGDEPCGNTTVVYTWEKGEQPGNCTITFSDDNVLNPDVVISDCDPAECQYGEYIFTLTQDNGYIDDDGNFVAVCSGTDDVSIWIFEEVDADAGLDQEFCDTYAFTLTAVPSEFCGEAGVNYFAWGEWVQVSGPSTATIADPSNWETGVTIDDSAPCAYGEYVFEWTEYNGFGIPFEGCTGSDLVSIFIYEQPTDVDAGDDQLLCNDFAFSLTATGSDYDCASSNWYSWTLIDQPDDAGCEVIITDGTTLNALVTVGPCTGECPFGEYVFRFTEYNGSADVNCTAYDEVSVFIFEQPLADAGDDVNECVDIAYTLGYCYDLNGSMKYCYSMYGIWTKSCGPGDVTFTDVNDPLTEVCFEQPGRYKLTWTLTNGAEDCEDEDEVIFDLLEQPTAIAEVTELAAPCDALCIDLGLALIDKYEYFGTDAGECPNFTDMAHWSYVDGPCIDPTTVTFADDTDPATELCVSYYGAYTVRWNEVNMAVDGLTQCYSFVDIFVEFYETPEPFAGDDDAICGNCYTLQGVQYEYEGGCNQHLNDYYYWESLPTNSCAVTFSDFESLTPMVCIPDDAACYGTYGFVLHESNGDCYGSDTVWICFSDEPGDIPICFWNNPNDCGPEWNGPDFVYNGCLYPDDVLEVCAEGYSYFQVNPWCDCPSWFDFSNPAFWGWTFEWSLISPAGTIATSQAGYFDFEAGEWVYPWIDIFWGECCDTARLYLTITPDGGVCGIGCENTMEYKFYVYHKPCIDIVDMSLEHPGFAEVGMTSEFCNNCPPNPCLLYDWTAEPCGHITSGQGTACIEVEWDSYVINDGWGQITLTVFDTCTGCCNYDELPIKIYPTGTLGDCPLSGHVYYQNNFNTPLNGVEIQLWNGTVPVMSTTSFNDIEGGNGVGYYEFTGINCTTNFGITATYDAPWYGANATDALAVELRTINAPMFPAWFVNQPLQEEAMDVNNNNNITATDALWIKQRAISMVNYFPAGNWAFEPGMSSTAGTYNIMTLNMGDANRSNIPNSMKSAPAIDLVNDGTMNVVTGQVFDLPIRIANANQFGAMTLNLEYNSALLEVVDVVSAEGMLDNISNGNVSIAWSNVNPMVLAENDVVLTLKVKAIGQISATESMFSIGMGSEFADRSASVIEPVTLKTYGITTAAAATDYFLSTNRPNPFSTSTFIEYTMPETGKVKLSVLDMLGQEIAVLVNATQTAGSYTVEFSAAGLATGVYIYKITVDGETRDFISTQRMVISH